MNNVADVSGAILTIDLGALVSNYRTLARKSGTADCAVAIKGEAYGLGLKPVAKSLWQAGCRSYFVARPSEGADLRHILPTARIFVLDGFVGDTAKFYHTHKLIPCLGSREQVAAWADRGRLAPCALHVDTGINRLGLSISDFKQIANDAKLNYRLNTILLMSHLACGDEKKNPLNHKQLERFSELRKLYPHLPASLANSPGIFLGKDFALDMTRPGVGLYGGNPTPYAKNPMRPVAHLAVRVLQVRDVKKGETVGYSATWAARRASKVAVISAGYRDGIPRKLSSSKPSGPAHVWLGGKRCPIIGRVSMDMMCVDVTSAPRVRAGDFAEIFGKRIDIEESATWAHTISYELLTHLGPRYARVYKGASSGR
jgi:alanine racemase